MKLVITFGHLNSPPKRWDLSRRKGRTETSVWAAIPTGHFVQFDLKQLKR